MRQAAAGPVRVSWNPEARLLAARFGGDAFSTFNERETLLATMRAWVGPEEPYGILACFEPGAVVDMNWRLLWSKFLQSDAARARVACVGLAAEERFFLAASTRLMHLRGAAFDTEDEGRAWLLAQAAA